MDKIHSYSTKLKWTGNQGTGTSGYRGYQRDYEIKSAVKPIIHGSSDPSFLGNPQKYNPEELLVASVSSCHMLWYLHLCSQEGIIVIRYEDDAQGRMIEYRDGRGVFESIVLKPKILVAKNSMIKEAIELHTKANEMCFVANSLSIRVEHKPEVSCRDQERI